ncbi:hypothetical protein GCM10010246_62840 [Streptomyces cuspidosporus]|uniref:Uncharacterized protein n=1 Tax=Streptomyces cuspidosporus TaxID=66882 RepID=A0ABN3GWH9_9ACTN
MGEVGERLDALVDLVLERFGVHPVGGDVLEVERLDVGAHGAQGGTGSGEMGALPLQRVGVVRGVRGHGVASGGLRQSEYGMEREAARFPCGRRLSLSGRRQDARL